MKFLSSLANWVWCDVIYGGTDVIYGGTDVIYGGSLDRLA